MTLIFAVRIARVSRYTYNVYNYIPRHAFRTVREKLNVDQKQRANNSIELSVRSFKKKHEHS